MRKIRQLLTVEILVRVLADILIVNAGLITGLIARIVGLLFFELGPISTREMQALILDSWFIYLRNAPLFTVLSLAIFYLSGFYTRGRAYRSRYKVIVILQAISISYLLFGFLTYFVPVLTRYPRSAFFTGWIVTAVFLIGARFWATTWGQVVRREDIVYQDIYKKNQRETVLVIGGAGYIGSVLCRQLLAKEYKVRVLDGLLYGDEGIRSLNVDTNFEFIRGDTRDIEIVASVMKGVDAVVHLGEIVGDPATGLDEEFTLEINIAATQMVAQVAKGYGVERFIYASSCSVYGANDELLTERSTLNPISIYARAKRDSESILLGLDDEEFHPIILRFGTVYGLSPRQRFDLVINLLTAKAVVDGEITIFGGDQWRPFVHVRDVARAIELVLEAPLVNVRRQIFNVGSDSQNYMITQIGEIIRQLIPNTKLVNKGTDIDQRNYRVSFAKIQQQLGFDPQVTVQQGVKEIEQAICSGKLGHYTERKYSNYKTLSDENGLLNLQDEFIVETRTPICTSPNAKWVPSISYEFKDWQKHFLETMVELAAISIDNAAFKDHLQRSHDIAVESWFRTLDHCQRETEGHTLRVTKMAVSVARAIGLTEVEITHLRRGALLHDIGRLAIPDQILVKPGPLTDDEWEIIYKHPLYAYEILSPMVKFRASLDIPYCHQERWDGTGYPRGLKGEKIPLTARIFSVVDVWDTLRSDKPYRTAWSEENAGEYIFTHAGKHFDPHVVETFEKVYSIYDKVQA